MRRSCLTIRQKRWRHAAIVPAVRRWGRYASPVVDGAVPDVFDKRFVQQEA